MSFLTGTGAELLYASNGSYTKASWTSEVTINTVANFGAPQAHLPIGFFLPNQNQRGRTLRITARGSLAAAAATTPTYLLSIRAGTAANTTLCKLLGSVAVATTSGGSGPWWLEGEVTITAIGTTGAASSILGRGTWSCEALAGTSTTSRIHVGLFGGGATPGTATIYNNDIMNFINVNVACSANSASNTFTLNELALWGLN